MNILFIDTETTGLNPQQHCMVQLSAEFHVDGKLIHKFNEKLKHDHATVDLGALKVNRVKFGQLNSYGQPEDLVVSNFIDFLLMLQQQYKDIVVCGHNVAFDLGFIKQAIQNMACSNADAVLPYRVLDTSVIARFLQSLGIKALDNVFGAQGNSLSAMAKALGIEVPNNLHDSAVDVELTAAVFYKFQQLLKGLINEDLAQEVLAS